MWFQNFRLSFKSAALSTAVGTILIGFAVAASDGETFTSPDLAAQALLPPKTTIRQASSKSWDRPPRKS
jgi:hypothetical protein